MSEMAGRTPIQTGAQSLEKSHAERGILFSGVSGVEPAKVIIIGGGGVVGSNAARLALPLFKGGAGWGYFKGFNPSQHSL